MSLSPGLEAEKALRIDKRIRAGFYQRLGHALMLCFEQKIKREKEYLEGVKVMRKKRAEKKKTIEPTGTMIPTKDYFKFRSENIGVFKKPEIKRKK